MKVNRQTCGIFLAVVGIILFMYLVGRRPKEGFQEMAVPTFHILIASAGNPLLKSMLDSLKTELLAGDAITIVFDGSDAMSKSTYTDDWLVGLKCVVKTFEEEPALGFWGHGIRNKYQGILEPRTTFIMNADDDDIYISGSFDKLRRKCVDPDTLYIAKLTYANNRNKIIPSEAKKFSLGNISTQNGIIPFDMASSGEWKPIYGGDYDYYKALEDTNPPIIFLDDIIYLKDVK